MTMGDYPQFTPQYHGIHCAGCRCFHSWFTTTTTLTAPYQPRHRKPGPAQ